MMKTLIAKLQEKIDQTKANMPEGGDLTQYIARLTAFRQAKKIALEHIGEHAVALYGENVVYLGDLDSKDGLTVSHPATVDQVALAMEEVNGKH